MSTTKQWLEYYEVSREKISSLWVADRDDTPPAPKTLVGWALEFQGDVSDHS